MIGYLKGKVKSYDNGSVILENNGIGFEVNCSNSSYTKLVNEGEGEVYVYTSVRDDGIFLYGFENLQERAMFLKLISVSGVGPKMAMLVLSGMPLRDLAYIIATSDVKNLSSIKGLGKKTAERIILELREKISALDVEEESKKKVVQESVLSATEEDAVIALMSLGFNRNSSVKAVKAAVESGADTVESIITVSLQLIR